MFWFIYLVRFLILPVHEQNIGPNLIFSGLHMQTVLFISGHRFSLGFLKKRVTWSLLYMDHVMIWMYAWAHHWHTSQWDSRCNQVLSFNVPLHSRVHDAVDLHNSSWRTSWEEFSKSNRISLPLFWNIPGPSHCPGHVL